MYEWWTKVFEYWIRKRPPPPKPACLLNPRRAAKLGTRLVSRTTSSKLPGKRWWMASSTSCFWKSSALKEVAARSRPEILRAVRAFLTLAAASAVARAEVRILDPTVWRDQTLSDVEYQRMRDASRAIIRPAPGPWRVRPLELVSNLELILEPGTVLEAARGAYQGLHDSLLTAVDAPISSFAATGPPSECSERTTPRPRMPLPNGAMRSDCTASRTSSLKA